MRLRERCVTFDRFADALEVLGGRTAAATDDVEQTVFRPAPDLAPFLLGRFVVLAECIGETCVRVSRDTKGCPASQLGDVGTQLICSSAQLKPTLTGSACATERAKASLV